MCTPPRARERKEFSKTRNKDLKGEPIPRSCNFCCTSSSVIRISSGNSLGSLCLLAKSGRPALKQIPGTGPIEDLVPVTWEIMVKIRRKRNKNLPDAPLHP